MLLRSDKDFDVSSWLDLYPACDWNRDWLVGNARVMLEHAHLVVTAWTGGALVGSLTVLSDGVNYATIDNVVVHPDCRRRGIGTGIVRHALERLDHLEGGLIKLHAIPGVESFYAGLGFSTVRETVMSPSWPRADVSPGPR